MQLLAVTNNDYVAYMGLQFFQCSKSQECNNTIKTNKTNKMNYAFIQPTQNNNKTITTTFNNDIMAIEDKAKAFSQANPGINMRDVILADNQSTCDVFCNSEFVTNIRKAGRSMTVFGNGGPLTSQYQHADRIFGKLNWGS